MPSSTVTSVNPADADAGNSSSSQQQQPVNKVEHGGTEATGTGNVAVSAPHIVQYPRPPKRDDGRWLALASVIGNIIGKLSSQKVVKQAKSAEDKWRDVMAKMKDIADRESDRVTPLRDKAQKAMDDLDLRNALNWQRGDLEYAYGERTKPCIDNLSDELCALADCGYQADYDGLMTRIKADAEASQYAEMEKICRMNNRYNTGWACEVKGQLAIATQAAVIAQTNKLREEERLNKWKYDAEIKRTTLQLMEQIRQNRSGIARDYDKTASTVRMNQYNAYTDDAHKSLKWGADLLAAHGQNAAWLADSLRKTAQSSMSDWGALATMITGLILAWNSKSFAAKADDCGGGGKDGKK